jgi:hypothetical protein
MTEHPITPPPELVAMWTGFSARHHSEGSVDYVLDLATKAAQWGADQELEACCEYLVRCAQWEPEDVDELRAARRPKPPSLKEQALDALESVKQRTTDPNIIEPLRRALEQLDD